MGVTDGFKLLDGALPAGHLALKLLSGFLGLGQLLPQDLLLLFHGGDLQEGNGRHHTTSATQLDEHGQL